MSLYEVVLTTVFQGQICVNRWNYVSGGTPAAVMPSFALTSAFGAIVTDGVAPFIFPDGTVMNKIQALLSGEVRFAQISVANVYDPVDFYETLIKSGTFGSLGGETLSPIVAFGFYSSRINADIRRGRKSFTGVVEAANSTGGQVAASTMADQAQPLADVMGEILVYDDEGSSLTFSPTIVQKEKYPVMKDGEPTGTSAYRYYQDPVVQNEHLATGISWTPYATLRGQQSRQYGRGR